MKADVKATRAIFKWPGGKYRLLKQLQPLLPPGKCLIEPFLGSGVVFLNFEYEHYILNDINPDLINFYKNLQQYGLDFAKYCRKFFCQETNNKEIYYRLRQQFNATTDNIEKSALFLYLNRHGYNGLCRYTLKGEFNVPYGKHERAVYFPQAAIEAFCKKATRAEFICGDFMQVLQQGDNTTVVYADPPYVALSETANFNQYSKQGFTIEQQQMLAQQAWQLAQQGSTVVLSNHNTAVTKKLYAKAKLIEVMVPRLISCKPSSRKATAELLAVYD